MKIWWQTPAEMPPRGLIWVLCWVGLASRSCSEPGNQASWAAIQRCDGGSPLLFSLYPEQAEMRLWFLHSHPHSLLYRWRDGLVSDARTSSTLHHNMHPHSQQRCSRRCYGIGSGVALTALCEHEVDISFPPVSILQRSQSLSFRSVLLYEGCMR